jgi:hypothetical protein
MSLGRGVLAAQCSVCISLGLVIALMIPCHGRLAQFS